MTLTVAMQHLLLAGFAAIFALCAVLFATWPRCRFCVIPPATWAINGMAFYGGMLAGIIPPGEVSILLSAVLRLHSVALVLGGLLILAWGEREEPHAG